MTSLFRLLWTRLRSFVHKDRLDLPFRCAGLAEPHWSAPGQQPGHGLARQKWSRHEHEPEGE